MGFENKDDVTKRFINAVHSINLAIDYRKNKNYAEERSKKLDAAIQLYQAFEWGIKYYLKVKNKMKKFEKKNVHQLLELMREVAIPPINSPDVRINVTLLSRIKELERNPAEHEGVEPSLERLIYVIPEVEKLLKLYVDPSVIFPVLKDTNEEFPNWNEFFVECEEFNVEDMNYILVVGSTQHLAEEKIINISNLPFKMVIDFDPDTHLNGFHYYFNKANELESYDLDHRTVFRKPIREEQQKTYWFFGNGRRDDADSLAPQLKEWKRLYDKAIDKLIEECAKNFKNPLKVIILHDNLQHVSRTLEKFYTHFGNNIEFLFAMPNKEEIEVLLDEYEDNSSYINISLDSIAEGARSYISYFHRDRVLEEILIPQRGAVSTVVSKNLMADIEQYLEIIHKNIGKSPKDVIDQENFYRGKTISWKGLHQRIDIINETGMSFERKIVSKLLSGDSAIFYLTHRPGIGGSTIGRRIAYNLRNEFPTLVLKNYKEIDTAAKIDQIYDLTKKSAFILAETSSVPLEKIENLAREMQSKNRPVVILVIKRGSKSLTQNQIIIDRIQDELYDFRDLYIGIIEASNDSPQKIKNKKDNLLVECSNRDIVPFNLGLIAYEDSYEGLGQYVKQFLNQIETDMQKKILIYLSLVYRYTSKGLSNSFLVNLLGFSTKRKDQHLFNLFDYLPEDYNQLIVEDKPTGQSVKIWRPKHYLIADEMKNQLLSGYSLGNWQDNLSSYAIDFIEDSVVKGTQSEYILDLIQELFIRRDSEDIKDEDFSALISHVNTKEAKEEVLLKLVECYPSEPHFYAHLARFYSFTEKNSKKALENIEKAIELNELQMLKQDPLLYHIKGMCIRAHIYDLMEFHRKRLRDDKVQINSQELALIQDMVQNAGKQFEISRGLTQDAHGYIANIQLLIKVVDFTFIMSGQKDRQKFMQNAHNTWINQCIDEAESLLESIKRIKENQENSYISSVDADLVEIFYSDYNQVIQHWNSILDKLEDKRFARRRIIRAYYHKFKSYKNMDQKTITRILELMESNIKDEPNNETNIHLWFSAARYAESIKLENVIDKVTKWRAFSKHVDVLFYLYILKFLKYLDGYSDAGPESLRLINECSQLALNLKLSNRTKIYEWYGQGTGLSSLIHYSEYFKGQPVDGTDKRGWLKGRIEEYTHPGKGVISYDHFKVFFQPSQANFGLGVNVTRDDIGKTVYFRLGFSYDGLIAEFKTVCFEEFLSQTKVRIENQIDIDLPEDTFNNPKVLEGINKHSIQYKKGDKIEVRVISIHKSFVNCELINGEKGQVYIGELATYFVQDIHDEVKIDQQLFVIILGYNEERGKWDLSRKAVDIKINSNQSIEQENENGSVFASKLRLALQQK